MHIGFLLTLLFPTVEESRQVSAFDYVAGGSHVINIIRFGLGRMTIIPLVKRAAATSFILNYFEA
jgi:hypothetical protein